MEAAKMTHKALHWCLGNTQVFWVQMLEWAPCTCAPTSWDMKQQLETEGENITGMSEEVNKLFSKDRI